MTGKSILRLVVIAAAALAGNYPALADDPAAVPIAVINIDRMFKTYKPLLDKLAPIDKAVLELEKEIQLKNVELETVVNKLRNSQPGTPESQRLQQQAAKLQGDLQQFAQKEGNDLQKRKMSAFISFFREVDEEVRKYSKAKGIKLVIRQQDAALDESQPFQENIKSLNRGILFEDGLDITDDILKALDERAQSDKKPR